MSTIDRRAMGRAGDQHEVDGRAMDCARCQQVDGKGEVRSRSRST